MVPDLLSTELRLHLFKDRSNLGLERGGCGPAGIVLMEFEHHLGLCTRLAQLSRTGCSLRATCLDHQTSVFDGSNTWGIRWKNQLRILLDEDRSN